MGALGAFETPSELQPGSLCRRTEVRLGVPKTAWDAALKRCSTQLLLAAIVASLLVLLSGCGHKKTAKNIPPPPTVTPSTQAPSKTEASAKPPAPTVETGKHSKPIYVETGLASWYGPPYHNRKGANGEIYDQNALTAAHRTLPMNSVVRVTNESTRHTVVVRITDRGPFIEDRMIDLSLAAAKAVDVWRPGTATVKIEVLTAPAPIFEGGRWCVQIGAFQSQHEARKLKEKLQDRYEDAQVIEFTGPTGEWVRLRPQGDDKRMAQEVASKTHVKEGGVFLVRLD
jgi:rare lipoprotein A